MMFRRFILGAVASAPMLAVMAGAAHAQAMSPDTAKSFITQSGDKLVAIVNGPGSQSQKASQLRDLVNQIVDVDQVGDYVLGRYINAVSYTHLTLPTRG